MSLKYSQLWDGDNIQISPWVDHAKNATRHYLVEGTDSDQEAISYLASKLKETGGDTYMGCVLQSLSIASRMSVYEWKIDASYAYETVSINSFDLPKETVTYDNQSQTQHITHSKHTVHSYANSGCTSKNFNGAICVNGEQDIEGCDIYVSSASMTITHYFRKSQMTTRLRNTILLAKNWVNDSEFRGFDRGEVLFTGAHITEHRDGTHAYFQVDYNFAISPNDSSVELAGWSGPAIEKKGWEYLWIYDVRDSNTLRSKPDNAYVEKVYSYNDLTKLGISRNG